MKNLQVKFHDADLKAINKKAESLGLKTPVFVRMFMRYILGQENAELRETVKAVEDMQEAVEKGKRVLLQAQAEYESMKGKYIKTQADIMLRKMAKQKAAEFVKNNPVGTMPQVMK